MAQYLVLIYENENDFANAGPDAYDEVMKAHDRFSKQWGDAIVGGNALQGGDTATTVRGDVVTDGVFVESKEVLGGYYLIEAADLDRALEIGKSCPARFGGVEVRPIMTY